MEITLYVTLAGDSSTVRPSHATLQAAAADELQWVVGAGQLIRLEAKTKPGKVATYINANEKVRKLAYLRMCVCVLNVCVLNV